MGIILTTGRSGSTAASRVLSDAPGCLSLPEALINMEALFLEPDLVLTGPEFATQIAEPTPVAATLFAHGLRTPEFWSGNRGRVRVPPLLVTTLGEAGLDDPDAAQAACVAWAATQGRARVGDHLSHLFSYLASLAGRSTWIERSGGSLYYGPELDVMFPAARSVVLLRDPLRTIRSMSTHLGFRVLAVRRELRRRLGYDPYLRNAPEVRPAGLPAPYNRLLPQTFDPRALADVRVPAEWFALYWSKSVFRGLGAVERGASTVVWVEELTQRPDDALDRLAWSLGLEVDSQWRAAAGAVLRRTQAGQTPLAAEGNRRLERLVRSARSAALDLTEPAHRPVLAVAGR